MKKLLAKMAVLALAGIVILNIAFSDVNTLPYRPDIGTSKVTGDHVNSETDTVLWAREPGVEALAIAAHWKDSVSLTRVVVRRIVNGDYTTAIAGDTVVSSAFAGATTADTSLTATVTLAPLCDMYAFIFVYAASNNGVTTPVVYYEAIKQIP